MKNVFFLIFLIFALMPAQAQDEPEPLPEILSRLPQASEGERAAIIYANMELAFDAWSGVPHAESIEAYEALTDRQRELYLKAFPHTGFPNVSRMAATANQAEILENFGFDYFRIEQSLYFYDGSFQAPSVIFNGNFDNQVIANGRLEEGYSLSGEILCPENGCDEPFAETEEAFDENPFGNNGAFVLGEGFFMNITSPERLAGVRAVLAGEATSRLEVPAYRASLSLLSNSGIVTQAVFVPSNYIAYVNEVITFLDDSEAEPLPEYELVTMAEILLEEGVEFHLILIYEAAEDAELAGENLEENLRNPALFSRGFWDNVDGNLESVEILEDSETGLFLLQAILSAPLPDVEAYSGFNAASLFNVFYDSSIIAGDLRYLLVED